MKTVIWVVSTSLNNRPIHQYRQQPITQRRELLVLFEVFLPLSVFNLKSRCFGTSYVVLCVSCLFVIQFFIEFPKINNIFNNSKFLVINLKNCGTVELWNCGIVELWNCGIVELRTRHFAFQKNRILTLHFRRLISDALANLSVL